MARSALVFVLTTDHFHAYPEIPPPVADADLVTPVLSFYFSAGIAAEHEEGLSFVEGDVVFFAADGSSLVPKFSREPYINEEQNSYFPGVYTLQPAKGKSLSEVLIERITKVQYSDDIRIVVAFPEDDEEAQFRGWKSASTMEEAIDAALAILPNKLKERIIS